MLICVCRLPREKGSRVLFYTVLHSQYNQTNDEQKRCAYNNENPNGHTKKNKTEFRRNDRMIDETGKSDVILVYIVYVNRFRTSEIHIVGAHT